MPRPTSPDPLAGHDKYALVRKLGSGAFGVVVEARVRSTGKSVPIKFIKRDNRDNETEPDQLPLLKICNFGYRWAHCMSKPKSEVGTPCYMAPEVINTTSAYDGKAADIWSCGVMLYVMLFGSYPFKSSKKDSQTEAQQNLSIMNQILAMEILTIPQGSKISGECRDLLHRMIVDKDKRIKMEDLLQHPWFTEKLPPNALIMNAGVSGNEVYSNLQINQILNDALTGLNKYNFSFAATNSNLLDGKIDTEDLLQGPMALQQQQVVMQTPAAITTMIKHNFPSAATDSNVLDGMIDTENLLQEEVALQQQQVVMQTQRQHERCPDRA
eukprot:gene14034-19972_t